MEIKTCNICNTENKIDAKFCKGCGNPFTTAMPDVNTSYEPDNICPSCSTLNKPDARFCKGCGNSLLREETPVVSDNFDDETVCKHSGEINVVNEEIGKNCEILLEEKAITPAPIPENICNYCGANNKSTAKFCKNCGANLEGSDIKEPDIVPEESVPPTKPDTQKNPFFHRAGDL